MRCSVSPTIAAGTVTTRSTVATFVYGSSGDASDGASLRSSGRSAPGVGVAVTPSTKPPSVDPRLADDGAQARPRRRTGRPTPSATTARAMASWTMSGRPRPRSIGSVGGQPAGLRGARSDLDRGGPTARRRSRSDVRRPRAAPGRHRADCRTGGARRGRSVLGAAVAACPSVRCGALYSGAVARVIDRRARPATRDGVQARDPRSGRSGGLPVDPATRPAVRRSASGRSPASRRRR